jgi:hypothetical protein
MRTELQIKQRTATIARLVRAAGERIASVSTTPTSTEKRRATMARKVLRTCAQELAAIDLSASAAHSRVLPPAPDTGTKRARKSASC